MLSSTSVTSDVPVPPPNADSETMWAFLKEGVDHIMTIRADCPYGKYMSLYTAVYNYCTSSRVRSTTSMAVDAGTCSNRTGANLMGSDLYHNLIQYFIVHLKNINDQSNGLHDEALLRYYAAEWNRYTGGARYVNRLFTFLNRHWVKRERDEGRKGVYPVYTLALVQWKANFFYCVQSKLTSVILQFIERERNGEMIDEGLVKEVVDSFVSLGLDERDISKASLDIYRKYLETPFLDATKEYYERESYAFLEQNSLSDYLRKVEERLEEEEDRVNQYLNAETRGELINLCEDVLIRQHSKLMRENLPSLFDSADEDDLQRMYTLLSRIPDGLEPLRSKFEEYVKAGLAAAAKLASEESVEPNLLDNQAYANALSEIHRQNSEIVARSFNGDAGFITSLDKSYREILPKS